MKFYQILILISLILLINSADFCDLEVQATKPEDCANLIKASRTNYCCYFKGMWKGKTYNGNCMDITPIPYNEMKEYIEEKNKEDGYNIEVLNCKSFNLKYGIFYFLIFLLL